MASPCLRQGHTMKQRDNEVAVNDSPQCAGSWPWGGARRRWRARALCRRVGVGGGASHRRTGNPLLSFLQLRFVLFTRRKKKKKRKRKKKVFFHLVGDPRECNFQALSLSFLSFLLPTPPQGRSGTCNAQVCSGPCLLSRLFHKAGWYSGFFQKKKKEREGRWLISCIWGNIKPYISRIHRGRRQDRKWAKPSEITWEKVRRIGFKWACIQGFPRSNAVPWGSKEEYEGRV